MKIKTTINKILYKLKKLTGDNVINKESKLDLMWEEYISTKDASSYKNIMSKYHQENRNIKLKYIQESCVFNNITYEHALYLKNFFLNNEKKVKPENLKPKLSNTQKSTIGVFLADIFNLREIKKSELLSEDINELLLYENIDIENFEELLKILDFTSLEKYDLILQKELLPFSKNEESLKACSSNVFDACYINYQNDVRKVILVSLETPIDAIFFPSSGLIITSDRLRFELISRLKKLFQFICKDIPHYSNYWTNDKDLFISHLIRDKRPYHVIADELSGYYYLQTKRENNLKLAFLQRSTFVEYDKLELDVFSYTLDELQKEGLGTLFFSSYYRLNRSEVSKNYENWLVNIARKAYENEIDSFKGQNIWIAITGGEKRYWIEEVETIVALIKYFQKKDKNTKFIFDGYTSTEIIDDATKINIAKHVIMFENIVKKTNLKESDYISVIGAQVLKKVAYAAKCSFCITSGTPAMWCSKIAKVPGVFHGNHEMMNRAFKDVCDTNSMMAIQKDKILEVGHEESAQKFQKRWDFVNYSIESDVVLDLIKDNEEASFEMGGGRFRADGIYSNEK